jgi:ribonuclease D
MPLRLPVPFEQTPADVTQTDQLHEAVTHLALNADVAVDVEADSMHHFSAKLCFVQLGSDTAIELVDAMSPELSLTPLASLMEGPSTKFFHAAGGDLTFLAEHNLRVKNLFDTHRAATLLNWPKVGLADLVKEKLGVELKKEHQQADFSQRPLPPELRAYIADDVRYLSEVGRLVRQACVDADILEEVILDCDRMCDEASIRKDVSVDYALKVSKAGLSKSAMQVADAVASWLHQRRLKWAQAADVPMGRMLSNAGISEIASQQPDDVKSLAKLKGVRGQVARDFGEEIVTELQRLKLLAEQGALPPAPTKRPKDLQQKKREDALVAWRKQMAEVRKVTPLVVLPNALLKSLVAAPPSSLDSLSTLKYFGAKRMALYGKALLDVLGAVS